VLFHYTRTSTYTHYLFTTFLVHTLFVVHTYTAPLLPSATWLPAHCLFLCIYHICLYTTRPLVWFTLGSHTPHTHCTCHHTYTPPAHAWFFISSVAVLDGSYTHCTDHLRIFSHFTCGCPHCALTHTHTRATACAHSVLAHAPPALSYAYTSVHHTPPVLRRTLRRAHCFRTHSTDTVIFCFAHCCNTVLTPLAPWLLPFYHHAPHATIAPVGFTVPPRVTGSFTAFSLAYSAHFSFCVLYTCLISSLGHFLCHSYTQFTHYTVHHFCLTLFTLLSHTQPIALPFVSSTCYVHHTAHTHTHTLPSYNSHYILHTHHHHTYLHSALHKLHFTHGSLFLGHTRYFACLHLLGSSIHTTPFSTPATCLTTTLHCLPCHGPFLPRFPLPHLATFISDSCRTVPLPPGLLCV